uniref:Zinc transporter ZIP11 n=1 Tax=Ditylenchus dipsaci TaxID=166011 RepID=A0A915DF28_9BILA
MCSPKSVTFSTPPLLPTTNRGLKRCAFGGWRARSSGQSATKNRSSTKPSLRHRLRSSRQSSKTASFELSPVCLESAEASQTDPLDNGLPNSSSPEMMLSWRRILLLIMAVTVHNIPEGLAVGVGFGSVGKTPAATLKRRLIWLWVLVCKISRKDWLFLCPWLDLDIQRPRHLSLLGAALVILMEPVLPYALAFAAGAMIYVVFDDIIPEAQRNGNGKLASAGTIVGFLVMMCMDVGLG